VSGLRTDTLKSLKKKGKSFSSAKFYEEVDESFLSSLQEVNRNGREIIYNCPWCEERYGPNEKRFYPKLYYNPSKRVGYCFRCNTVMVVKSDGLSFLSEGDQPVAPSLGEANKSIEPINNLNLALPIERDKKKALSYMLNRSPYLVEIISEKPFEFYQANFGKGLMGVVFPFRVEGEIWSYQVRFFREDGGDPETRYETRPGVKVPYHPYGISFGEVESITLVEGVFGTFGILYLEKNIDLFSEEIESLGIPVESFRLALRNPIATLGYGISESVLWAIKSMAPLHVVIAMDEKRLSEQARSIIVENVTSVERVDIINIGDPDDFAKSLYSKLRGW
jgi:hypothetical protein